MIDAAAAAERPEGITPVPGRFGVRRRRAEGNGNPGEEKKEKSRGARVGAWRALGLVGASSATCARNVVVVPVPPPPPHRPLPSRAGPQSPSPLPVPVDLLLSPPFPSSLALSPVLPPLLFFSAVILSRRLVWSDGAWRRLRAISLGGDELRLLLLLVSS
ncbi:hypothetical protein PAHAL_9G124400 [Panicum hallii]|uniref:Uncharacterized protein n=1 Tax=Panicum hallii TaxID=206008 RepID=A0A2T8I154_9POAL|nr:hypothetical protein PAHAL_9G124400 [Panicum hallii]